MAFPANSTITLPELIEKVKPFDIFLVKRGAAWSGKMIAWGQRGMLKEYGYSNADITFASEYVHVMQLIKITNSVIVEESVLPEVTESDILKYVGKELLWLRLTPNLTQFNIITGHQAAQKWLGHKYDILQYAAYPFMMACGRVAPWWRKLWDDPTKPVCSDLVLNICHAVARLLQYKDNLKVPPARFTLLEGIEIMGNITITAPAMQMGRIEVLLPWLI